MDVQVAVAGVAEVADGNTLGLTGCRGCRREIRRCGQQERQRQLVKELPCRLNDSENALRAAQTSLFQARLSNNERVVSPHFFGKLMSDHLRPVSSDSHVDQSHEYIRAGLLTVYDELGIRCCR